MLSGKFFRNMREKIFGIQRRGGAFDGERALLVDFDRFTNTVVQLVQDFANNYNHLTQMHLPLFQLCDVLYPVATPARSHIVAIKDLLEIFGQRFNKTEDQIQQIKAHAVSAIDRNQAIFSALEEIDKLQLLVEHYDKKLQGLNGNLNNAQANASGAKVQVQHEKIQRNESKREANKKRLEMLQRDVEVDIHDIVQNRMRTSNYMIAEIAEMYSSAFDDLQQCSELLREQASLLKMKANETPSKSPNSPQQRSNYGSNSPVDFDISNNIGNNLNIQNLNQNSMSNPQQQQGGPLIQQNHNLNHNNMSGPGSGSGPSGPSVQFNLNSNNNGPGAGSAGGGPGQTQFQHGPTPSYSSSNQQQYQQQGPPYQQSNTQSQSTNYNSNNFHGGPGPGQGSQYGGPSPNVNYGGGPQGPGHGPSSFFSPTPRNIGGGQNSFHPTPPPQPPGHGGGGQGGGQSGQPPTNRQGNSNHNESNDWGGF